MPKTPAEFDPLLLSSIDEALLSLGESVKTSIYLYLERNTKVTRNQIPNNLPQFQNGLEKIFGLGARFLEILIMKNLYAKVGCVLPIKTEGELEFVKYVDAARQSYLKGCPGDNNC